MFIRKHAISVSQVLRIAIWKVVVHFGIGFNYVPYYHCVLRN